MTQGVAAFGTLLQRGDGATPTEGFTTIAELQTIEIPAVETDIIDMTHHTSPGAYREYLLGLRDGGEVSLEGNYIPKNATQNLSTGLLGDNISGVVRNFKLLFSDGIAAAFAQLNSTMTLPNANIHWTAVASGTGGNAVTVVFVVAGVSTALSINVVANAITVNVGTNATSQPISTADQVIAAVAASAPATALVISSRGANADGTGVVNALSVANLAGGAAAIAATFWTFAALVRNFVVSAPHDGKLGFRGTLKVTGQPVLA